MEKIIDTGLFDRRRSGINTLTRRAFMFAISVFTAMNIVVAALGAVVSYNLAFNNGWLLLLFMLVCMLVSVAGAFIAHSNDNPMTSVVGGFICAGAMGVMVGPFVAMYVISSVMQALAVTVGVVVLTGFVGALIPNDLSMWGAPLFAGLLGLIVLYLFAPLLGLLGIGVGFTITILDVIGIVLFSAIMIYDLNMAQRLDRTLNNAIDVAVDIFLNFANIFIRVLSLIGKRK